MNDLLNVSVLPFLVDAKMEVLGLTPLCTGKFFVVGLKAVHRGFVMHLQSIDTIHKLDHPLRNCITVLRHHCSRNTKFSWTDHPPLLQ
jgi:hypothetical protein